MCKNDSASLPPEESRSAIFAAVIGYQRGDVLAIFRSTVSTQFLSSPLSNTEWAINGILPVLVLDAGVDDDLHETGGILKEEAKKRRGGKQGDEHWRHVPQPSPTTWSEPATSWMKWVTLLQTRLTDCPTDTLTRCALASLLEELGQLEEALCNWNVVLVCGPNSLKAREGMARCRQRIGQPLQSIP